MHITPFYSMPIIHVITIIMTKWNQRFQYESLNKPMCSYINIKHIINTVCGDTKQRSKKTKLVVELNSQVKYMGCNNVADLHSLIA